MKEGNGSEDTSSGHDKQDLREGESRGEGESESHEEREKMSAVAVLGKEMLWKLPRLKREINEEKSRFSSLKCSMMIFFLFSPFMFTYLPHIPRMLFQWAMGFRFPKPVFMSFHPRFPQLELMVVQRGSRLPQEELIRFHPMLRLPISPLSLFQSRSSGANRFPDPIRRLFQLGARLPAPARRLFQAGDRLPAPTRRLVQDGDRFPVISSTSCSMSSSYSESIEGDASSKRAGEK